MTECIYLFQHETMRIQYDNHHSCYSHIKTILINIVVIKGYAATLTPLINQSAIGKKIVIVGGILATSN